MNDLKSYKALFLLIFRGGNPKDLIMRSFCAFTMAEILISLTIIGIIAAITLPALQGNINEKVWNTKRKALYSRMSQAIALMPALNGYGDYSGIWANEVVTVDEDTAAMSFVTDGLAKVLKINNICDSEHLEDCGINSTLTTALGTTVNFPQKISELNPNFVTTNNHSTYGDFVNPHKNIDTKIAAFETVNGESVAVFYNPLCVDSKLAGNVNYPIFISIMPNICANFIFDVNGIKGPNTMGKDIGFMTAFYPTDSTLVAPYPVNTDLSLTLNFNNAVSACTEQDNSRLPNLEELGALSFNKSLLNVDTGVNGEGGSYWSSSFVSATQAWAFAFRYGVYAINSKSTKFYVRCIKR